jgi:hypothetical protein
VRRRSSLLSGGYRWNGKEKGVVNGVAPRGYKIKGMVKRKEKGTGRGDERHNIPFGRVAKERL